MQSLNHKSWAWEFLDRTACVCACVCVRVRLFTQSCLILCDLMDCSPPGSSIHGHFQARALEWVSSVLFSLSVVSDSLRPHELQHARPPCPSLTPGVHPNPYPELVMPSNHLILCCPLLLLPSIFPSIRVFSNELALCIRWPVIGTSASVLPMNIQD